METKGISQLTGLAGVYYVAYDLVVRNYHATITLRNAPFVDILVASNDGSIMLSLQVKTSRYAHRPRRYGFEVREWDVGSSAVGHFSESFWYAFVDLQEEPNLSRNPIVFLVPSLWVGNFIKADFSRKMFLLRSQLWELCRERWDLIEGYLSGDPKTKEWCTTIPEMAKHW